MTIKALLQLVKATIELPGPRRRAGKTSLDTSQARGAIAAAAAAMKVIKHVNGSHPKVAAVSGSLSSR